MHLIDAVDLIYLGRSSAHRTMSIAKPVLRILDREAALDFYCRQIGFSVDWEYRSGKELPVYMQVSLNGLSLHLSEHAGDCAPGGKVHIEDFTGLKAFHRQLPVNGSERPKIGPAFWDESVTMMEITDPFGNKLVFTENIPF